MVSSELFALGCEIIQYGSVCLSDIYNTGQIVLFVNATKVILKHARSSTTTCSLLTLFFCSQLLYYGFVEVLTTVGSHHLCFPSTFILLIILSLVFPLTFFFFYLSTYSLGDK